MNFLHTSQFGPGLRPSGRVAVAAIGLALLTGAPAAQAAFPGANGQIAVAAFSFSQAEGSPIERSARSIDAVAPDGSARRSLRACNRLTGTPDSGDCSIDYRSPAWSPKGKSLAFEAGARLALMRSDGTSLRLLEQQTAHDGDPAWSPNETQLVFTGLAGGSGQSDLYVLDLLSARSTRLTFRGARSPAWSSGGRIAFTRGGRPDKPGTGDIYTVRPDGSGLRRITYRGGSDPAWSPYATKLAFVRQPPRGYPKLYLAGRTGAGCAGSPPPEPTAPCSQPGPQTASKSPTPASTAASRPSAWTEPDCGRSPAAATPAKEASARTPPTGSQ